MQDRVSDSESGEQDYRTLFELMPLACCVHDQQGRVVEANQQLWRLLQRDPDLSGDVNMLEEPLLHWQDRQQMALRWQQLAEGGRSFQEVRLLTTDRDMQRVAELQTVDFSFQGGRKLLTTFSNISRQKQAETLLEDQMSFLQDFFDTIPCPAFYKNSQGTYLGCNGAFAQQIIGIAPEKLIGHSLFDLPELIPPEKAQVYYEHDNQLFDSGGQQVYETKVQCADGMQRDFLFSKSTFNNAAGEIAGLCGVMIDLTPRVDAELKLRQANVELQRLSHLDAMTGIGNRRYFDLNYRRYWHESQFAATPLSLIMIDIDYFKNYNDHYGHPAGDACIRRVAETLQGHVLRQGDLVARYGGEEFAILLPDTNLESAAAIAERVRAAIKAQEISHQQSHIAEHVTISLGVCSVVPCADQVAEKLLKGADSALYLSKQQGRDRVTEFSNKTN
ncbi:MAG: diguanylate cyclase [Motiliproteus sp.]